MQHDPSTVGWVISCTSGNADGSHGSSPHGACFMLHTHAQRGNSCSKPTTADPEGCSVQLTAVWLPQGIACSSFHICRMAAWL